MQYCSSIKKHVVKDYLKTQGKCPWHLIKRKEWFTKLAVSLGAVGSVGRIQERCSLLMDSAAYPSAASDPCPWAGRNLHHWTGRPFLLPLGLIPTQKPFIKHNQLMSLPCLAPSQARDSLRVAARVSTVVPRNLTDFIFHIPPKPSLPPATLSSLVFEHAVLCTGIFLWPCISARNTLPQLPTGLPTSPLSDLLKWLKLHPFNQDFFL